MHRKLLLIDALIAPRKGAGAGHIGSLRGCVHEKATRAGGRVS